MIHHWKVCASGEDPRDSICHSLHIIPLDHRLYLPSFALALVVDLAVADNDDDAVVAVVAVAVAAAVAVAVGVGGSHGVDDGAHVVAA